MAWLGVLVLQSWDSMTNSQDYRSPMEAWKADLTELTTAVMTQDDLQSVMRTILCTCRGKQ